MSVIQPVILSGGSGTRLWPASRALYPKQLQALVSERTMLQDTALRLTHKANVSGDTLVICNEAHRHLVASQLDTMGRAARIVLEPVGRNTAPAAALAALLALRDAPKGEAPLLLIMPADHAIENPAAFLASVEAGEAAAAEGELVMFGVVPSYPHTGYGYIEADASEGEVSAIQSFVEKPDQKTAVTLLETNRFFWNSGIFLFRADTYLAELEEFEPAMVAACRASIDKLGEDGGFLRPDADAFAACPSNSIDYAVMERTERGAMVPMEAGWSDVGSWAALHEVSAKDEDDNVIAGDVIALRCKSSYVSAASRLVTVVGLKSMVVVEQADAVLVAHKDHTQDVKVLVERLEAAGRAETREPREVAEPWGSRERLDAGDGFLVERYVVDSGGSVPEIADAGRDGHWRVVRGKAEVGLGGETVELGVGQAVDVAAGTAVRISNAGEGPLVVIAVRCKTPV